MRIKNQPSLLAISLLSLSLFACTKAVNGQSPEKKAADPYEAIILKDGYTKVFEDEFENDLSKWNIWEGGAYNNELQLYRNQADNLRLENGILIITAKKGQVQGKTLPENNTIKAFDFTSGRIESKFTLSASSSTPTVRVTAKIKLPLGTGMWPAFWTYGDNWPTNGEIDILEATGEADNYITNYFYGKKPGVSETNNDLTVKKITSGTNLTDSYHIYEAIWTRNSITYLLDGKVVNIKEAGQPGMQLIPEFFGKTQHVVLNLAVGGDIFDKKPDPADIKPGALYVDWVKVYTK